jgi:hypothetical protein
MSSRPSDQKAITQSVTCILDAIEFVRSTGDPPRRRYRMGKVTPPNDLRAALVFLWIIIMRKIWKLSRPPSVGEPD